MSTLIARLVAEEAGQDLIEYAFLAVFIAFGVITGMQAIAGSLNSQMTNIGSSIASGS